jgi:Domain of unknown function (DUF4411)
MYLLDSDVFIQAKNRHYGFDIVPAWWDWLMQAHQAGRVFTVGACRDEVVAGADELATWMTAQPASFVLQPQGSDRPSLQRVSQWAVDSTQYDQGAAAQFLAAGDYFLVSQALSLGYTVVTHEEPAPLGKKRIKIPDACNAAGVPWMPPWRMLRDEGARFRL